MIKLSKADEQILLCIASGLPPVKWRNKCKTPDQLEHWDNIRSTYQFVYYELKAFFEGQESLIPVNNKLDKLHKDYYTALADYYIAVYACIRKAWKAIQIEAKKKNVEIQDTPGDAIYQIFIDDCWFDFSFCLESFYECRPRENYNMWLELSKICQAAGGRKQDELVSDKKLVYRAKKLFKKINKYYTRRMQPRIIYFYLEVVKQEAKKDENLAASYFHLGRIFKNIELFLGRLSISRHAKPAYNWVNGVKKPYK